MTRTAILRAEGAARLFGELVALKDVTVELHAGEILTLLGASGSGKSTLLRLLALVDGPTTGRILLDGRSIPPAGGAWLAAIRRIGLVQQRPGLLRATTIENVAFPLRARGASRASAEQAAFTWLERLGLAARAGARASTLSGGEAQRAALARALVSRPDILLLDEATNQLDGESTRRIESILREEAARGAAIALVSHNVQQARRLGDRFVFLAEGAPLEAGSRAQLEAPRTRELEVFLEYA